MRTIGVWYALSSSSPQTLGCMSHLVLVLVKGLGVFFDILTPTHAHTIYVWHIPQYKIGINKALDKTIILAFNNLLSMRLSQPGIQKTLSPIHYLHSKLRSITLEATKVHVILLRSYATLTCMCYKR